MPALYVMIPAALLIVAVAIYIFFWAVDSGQYDDLDGPAHSVLFDDQDPQHLAAMEQATGHPPEAQKEEPQADKKDEQPPHA
jgi:cbb3-type cytochrome oxidase maturation protein